MVRIEQHPVLAVDQPLDELVERLVAQRHVRTAERRTTSSRPARALAFEDDDRGEAHETRLADDVDLGVVVGFERRDAVAAPVGNRSWNLEASSASSVGSSSSPRTTRARLRRYADGSVGPVRRPSLLEDAVGDDAGGLASDRRSHVGVQVERDADGGVAEPFADDLRVDAGLEGERGVGVPQVVEADRRQSRRGDELAELLVNTSGCSRTPASSRNTRSGVAVQAGPAIRRSSR